MSRPPPPIPESYAAKTPPTPPPPNTGDDDDDAKRREAEFDRAQQRQREKKKKAVPPPPRPQSSTREATPPPGPPPSASSSSTLPKKGSFIDRFLPRMPSAPPPPPAEQARAEVEFDAKRREALDKKAAATGPDSTNKHSSFSFVQRFLPRMPSAPPPTAEENAFAEAQFDAQRRDAAAKRMADAVANGSSTGMETNKRSSFMMRFLPRMPSSPPPTLEEQAKAEAEFDRARERAMEQRGVTSGPSPMHRLTSMGSAFFTTLASPRNKPGGLFNDELEPDEIETPAPPPPPPKTKSLFQKFMYEVQYRHAIERIMMAGIAISLLWLTSLTVAKSIVYGSLSSPTPESVVESIDFAGNVTLEVRQEYALCAIRRGRECNDSFYKDLTTEVIHTQKILDANRASLDNYTLIRLTCTQSFGNVLVAIDYMQHVKNVPYTPDFLTPFGSTNASSDVCGSVAQTLQGQVAAINAAQNANAYQQSSNQRVGFLAGAYDQQSAYNDAYVANLSSQLSVAGANLQTLDKDPGILFDNMVESRDQFLSCGTQYGYYNGQQCPGPTLIQRYDNMRQGAVISYQNALSSFKTFTDSVTGGYTPLFSFYTNFKNVMADQAIANDVAAAIGGDLYTILGFDSSVDGSLPTLQLPPASSYAASIPTTAPIAVSNAADAAALTTQQDAVQAQAVADNTRMSQQQVAWIQGFYSDYNPPPFDSSAASSSFSQSSSGFLPELQQDLNLVGSAVHPVQQDQFHPDTNTTVSGRTAQDLLQDNPVRSFNVYVYGISIPDLLIKWRLCVSISLNMDIVYRSFRTYSTIMKYWRISEVMAPPADVRLKGLLKKGQIKADTRTPDQKMADLITSPASTLLLALAFVGVVAGVFLGTYLKLYNEYVIGCVHGTYDGRGTIITRNAATVAFQFAAQYGDSIEQTSKDRINTQRQIECNKNQDSSFKQQNGYRQEYLWDVDQMDQTWQKVNSFQQCIWAAKIDANFTTQLMYNATNGTASGGVQSNLYDPNCGPGLSKFPFLNPYEFDCAAIQVCNPVCDFAANGNESVTRPTWDAGCKVEYYIHSAVFGTVISILAYVLMNISRLVFLHGSKAAFFRHFSTGDYNYLASTTEYGEILHPLEVKHKGKSMKEHVRDELHRTLKNFERTGVLTIMLAGFINVPWIVLLVYVSSTLQFVNNGDGGS